MSDNHNHHNNGFGNGFLLAMAIGAGLVFLFGTKRGQELVDEVTEKGSALLDEIIDLLGETEEEIQELAQPQPENPTLIAEPIVEQAPILASIPAPAPAGLQLVQTVPQEQPMQHEEMDDSPSPTPLYVSTLQKTASRRMFHGIPKRK